MYSCLLLWCIAVGRLLSDDWTLFSDFLNGTQNFLSVYYVLPSTIGSLGQAYSPSVAVRSPWTQTANML